MLSYKDLPWVTANYPTGVYMKTQQSFCKYRKNIHK